MFSNDETKEAWLMLSNHEDIYRILKSLCPHESQITPFVINAFDFLKDKKIDTSKVRFDELIKAFKGAENE